MILAGGHAGEAELARCRAEGLAVARCQHSGIVHIQHVGEHEGMPFFALEYVQGGDLAERIDRKPQPPRAAAELVQRLAQAMQFAHGRDVVHRDLKPGNVLLTGDCEPKITDSGLAKAIDDDSRQTRSGSVLGTPSDMAPEQALGNARHAGPPAGQFFGLCLARTGNHADHAENVDPSVRLRSAAIYALCSATAPPESAEGYHASA